MTGMEYFFLLISYFNLKCLCSQVEEDTDNYMQHKIMPKTVLRLKKGILPHKFQCQKNNESHSHPKRKSLKGRNHIQIIDDAQSVIPAKKI